MAFNLAFKGLIYKAKGRNDTEIKKTDFVDAVKKNGNEYLHRLQKLYLNTHKWKFCHYS